VIVHRDREDLFRTILADHISVEFFLDLFRLRQLAILKSRSLFLQFILDDVVAKLDAFVADIHGRTRNQLADFVLTLSAKRTIQQFVLVFALFVITHIGTRNYPKV